MDVALIACRFVHFGAAMLLLGLAVFDGALLPGGFAGRLRPLGGWIETALGVLLALTGLGWFGLEAGLAVGDWSGAADPGIWLALTTGTAFGPVWLLHLALIAALLLAQLSREDSRRLGTIVLSAALLLSFGLAGHAAMQDGALGIVHRTSHALHVLAAGFWVGCLLPLALCLLQVRDPAQRGPTLTALARFSGLGPAAVGLALLTGIINTALTLRHWPADPGSPYQLLLLIKIALVALMIGIALVNRYWAMPRLELGEAAAVRPLVWGALIELTLGVVVVGLVSAFATFDPV